MGTENKNEFRIVPKSQNTFSETKKIKSIRDISFLLKFIEKKMLVQSDQNHVQRSQVNVSRTILHFICTKIMNHILRDQ